MYDENYKKKKNVTLNESNTPFMPCTKHTKSILFKVV